MAQAIVPCALEFMDAQAIAMIRDYSAIDLPRDTGALLMIEVDGPEAAMAEAITRIHAAAATTGLLQIETAEDEEQVAGLWAARKALSPALRTIAPKKINEDVVVPVSKIPALIDGLSELARRYDVIIVNFGHAGNGNIHVNLLVNPDAPGEMARAEACLADVFELVLKLHGTLSGEHGVGLEKRAYITREIGATELSLMRGIKSQFDPLGLLNPDKMFPP
jgi:D-lactate dehydrogenase